MKRILKTLWVAAVLICLICSVALTFSAPCGAEGAGEAATDQIENVPGETGQSVEIAGATEETRFDLKTWWEQKALPMLIAGGFSAALLLAEVMPVIRGVKKSSTKFNNATKDVNAVSATNVTVMNEWKKEKKEFLDMIAALRQEDRERISAYEEAQKQREETFLAAVGEMRHVVSTYQTDLAASEGRLASELKHVEVTSDKTREMVYLGFTNLKEEVESGVARQIAEVEERNDEG